MAKLLAIGVATVMAVTVAAGVGYASPMPAATQPTTAYVYGQPYVYTPYGYGCYGPYDDAACYGYPPYGYGLGFGFGDGIFFWPW